MTNLTYPLFIFFAENRDLCRPFIVDEKHVGLIPPYVFKYLHEFPSGNYVLAETVMVLVDGDCHGKGYVTPIVVNANEILFLPIRVFLSKSSPHYMILQGLIGQLNNHKVNHLHNLQTITMGII